MTLRIRFRVKRLVSADIADRPAALVCEPCERECLAYVQDFLSMDLITQQWISGSIRGSTIGWSKWLHNHRIPDGRKRRNQTHLSRNVVVKVPSVLRIVVFGTEWGAGVTMNIGPVNATKERVGPQNCVRRIRREEPPLFRARLALIRSA